MAETAAPGRVVTVFGGTGFLGRRVVRHLRSRGHTVRIAARHPERGQDNAGTVGPEPARTRADIHDEASVAAAVAGSWAVVNAVSLYVERGRETFHAVHVEAAGRLAAAARAGGVERFVQLSGIGADPGSGSLYIRKRGEGERAVQAAFPAATIMRPAVMFGPDDAFLNTLVRLLRLPLYPMFGQGNTRLQPAYVEDVGSAISAALQRPQAQSTTFECGGPRIYTYAELLRVIANHIGREPLLIPVPFAVWHMLTRVTAVVPGAPLTSSQVELMEIDTIVSPGTPGLSELGVIPRPLEATLSDIVPRR
jgi:uncharacterized protein YbjT (DUF2867 family)